MTVGICTLGCAIGIPTAIMAKLDVNGTRGSLHCSSISQICTFDGKVITMEDVQKLPVADSLELQNELTAAGLMGSPKVLSHLSEKAGSPMKA